MDTKKSAICELLQAAVWIITVFVLMAQAALSADIYCSSTATGSNNGTSWTNAYTSLTTAIAATSSGDTLYLNAPRTTPFSGSYTVTNKDRCRIVGNQGPDRETWLFGGLTATDWVNASGVWSKAGFAAEPFMVAYDMKQDDYAGTVTGCAVTQEIAAYTGRLGWQPNEARAWYGFLIENTGTPTTPADGEYGYSAGTLYVNPPGTPVEASVDSLTVYSTPTVTHGLYMVDCDNTRVEGVTAYWYPVANGNDGYGLRGDNCTGFTFSRCRAIVCGWHSIGFAGGYSGNVGNYDCNIEDCFATGCTGDDTGSAGWAINPYVIFQHTAPTRWGNNTGSRNVALVYPRLRTTGAPIVSTWAAIPFITHATSGTSYTNVTWADNFACDWTDQLVTKHTLAMTSVGEYIQHANGPAVTFTNPSTYPVVSKRNIFVGRFVPSKTSAIYYKSNLMDRSGNGTASTAATTGVAATPFFYLEDCTLLTGNYIGGATGFFSNMGAGDYLCMTGSKTRVLIEATTAKSALVIQDSDTGTTDNILFLGGDYDSNTSTTHALVRCSNATIYTNNLRDVLSGGTNRFGNGLEGLAYHNNTGAVPTPWTRATWSSTITGATNDVGLISLGWGSTAADKVAFLRNTWLKENPLPRPFLSRGTVSQ